MDVLQDETDKYFYSLLGEFDMYLLGTVTSGKKKKKKTKIRKDTDVVISTTAKIDVTYITCSVVPTMEE